MNIAIISDAFPPQRTSASVHIRDLATEILVQGYKPIVVVPAPGLSRKWEVEESRGIQIIRVKTMKMKDVGYFRRTLAEALMPFIIMSRIYQSGKNREKWDAIIWYSPTIFFGPLIHYLKRIHHCRTYLILRDVFPEWAVDMGLMRRGLVYRIFKIVEYFQYMAADTIGIQSETARPYMRDLLKSRSIKVELLRSWYSDIEKSYCSINIAETRLNGRKICVYTGNMGIAQNVSIFLDLATILRNRNDIGFLFVGRGSEVRHLKSIAETEQLDNVLFHDEIEPDEITGLLKQCHVGLVALDPRHTTSNVPGKFITYLQSALPVLACVNEDNEIISLIDENGLGHVSGKRDVEVIRGKLLTLLKSETERQHIGQRCRSTFEAMFSSSKAVRQILQEVLPE